jgi:hypothetical protein
MVAAIRLRYPDFLSKINQTIHTYLVITLFVWLWHPNREPVYLHELVKAGWRIVVHLLNYA